MAKAKAKNVSSEAVRLATEKADGSVFSVDGNILCSVTVSGRVYFFLPKESWLSGDKLRDDISPSEAVSMAKRCTSAWSIDGTAAKKI